MKDSLGDRMKEQYEDRTRIYLPRRTNTIIRVDGRAFHTLTRGLDKPWDTTFALVMDEVTAVLCEEIQGAKLGFVQSDEVSILLTDYDKITTEAWFNGNLQKMVSIAAAIATREFNHYSDTFDDIGNNFTINDATFDARAFTIPDWEEVINYFVWRQKDAVRNSITMLAQSLYSHKELHGKSQSEMQDMIHTKGKNWNNEPEGFRRGRAFKYNKGEGWNKVPCPIFTQHREFFEDIR